MSYSIRFYTKDGTLYESLTKKVGLLEKKIKTRLFVIVGLVLVIGAMLAVLINHHLSIREFESNNTPDQLRGIISNCACQERVKTNPDTIELCTQPFIDWENSTHYIDNNICEWKKK